MDEDFAVGRRLEDRSLGHEVGAEGLGVRQVAVVRQRERAFAIARENWLRVRDDRRAGGGVARVTDRDVAGETGHDLLAEDVGDESHATMRPGDASSIHRDHASRFLAAMLEAVEPEIREAGGLRNARYADDAAHPPISLPCAVEWR